MLSSKTLWVVLLLVVGISSALLTSVFTIEYFSSGICWYTTEY